MTCPTPPGFTHSEEIEGLIKCLSRSPHIGTAILDSDFRYLSLNRSLAAMNGAPVESHLGKTLKDVLGSLAEELEPHIESVFATGEGTSFEIVGRLSKRREEGCWQVIYLPLRNQLRQVQQVCAIVSERMDKNLHTSLLGLRSKLCTLRSIVNGEWHTAVDNEGCSTGSILGILNVCISEAIAISRMTNGPLQQVTQEALDQNNSDYQRGKITPMALHSGASLSEKLTEREREVVRYLAQGNCNKEIAAALGISVKTVETYRTRIMPKLGAHSLSDVTRFAVRHGLITISQDETS